MLTEEKRISFNSGYTKAGFADKVFHIHLRYIGDNEELYFRDYLREHPQIAKEYETLKLNLFLCLLQGSYLTGTRELNLLFRAFVILPWQYSVMKNQ